MHTGSVNSSQRGATAWGRPDTRHPRIVRTWLSLAKGAAGSGGIVGFAGFKDSWITRPGPAQLRPI